MPKPLRKPGYDVVPEGTCRRYFLDEMFVLYRKAGRPPLREVAQWISQNNELRGTASAETVRRVLRGHVPPRWITVEAIVLAFCDFAGIDANAASYSYRGFGDDDPESHIEAAQRLWSDAFDEELPEAVPKQQDDPWASVTPAHDADLPF